MKRIGRFAAPLALAATCWGCTSFGMFEDVGTDLHPPELQLLGIALQPPTDAEGVMPPPAFVPPAAGLLLQPDDTTRNTMILRVAFTDLGADIVQFRVRDRDSAFSASGVPVAPKVDTNGDGILEELDTPEFFAGIRGIVDLKDVKLDKGINGEHRLEIWAEDSLESRSPKTTFVVTLQH